MKSILTAIALFVLPLVAHAQAIINMPNINQKHEVVYTRIQPFELDAYSQSGYLFRIDDGSDNSGILYCADGHSRLRAEIPVAGEEITGFFDFESKEICSKVFEAMSAHPGLRVRFTLEISAGSHPYPKNMSWLGGNVTRVEWLDDAK